MTFELLLVASVLVVAFAYFFTDEARAVYDWLSRGINIARIVLLLAIIFFGATAGSLGLLILALLALGYAVLYLWFDADRPSTGVFRR